MEYLYYFENASLTLRIFEYLYSKHQMPAKVTVIHQIDGWLVRVKIYSTLNSQQDEDLQAFLNGGIPEKTIKAPKYFLSLEAGHSPIDIMRRYQVVVVVHSSPVRQELKRSGNFFVPSKIMLQTLA